MAARKEKHGRKASRSPVASFGRLRAEGEKGREIGRYLTRKKKTRKRRGKKKRNRRK
ncbi:hypothetical protein Tsubulata_015681, partial [Turnera subulata]